MEGGEFFALRLGAATAGDELRIRQRFDALGDRFGDGADADNYDSVLLVHSFSLGALLV
jgi:hypothetical protein